MCFYIQYCRCQQVIFSSHQVPGAEGRAGMAAIVEPEEGLDLKKFLQAVKHQLPSYAIPLFVRVVEKVDLTGRVNAVALEDLRWPSFC